MSVYVHNENGKLKINYRKKRIWLNEENVMMLEIYDFEIVCPVESDKVSN